MASESHGRIVETALGEDCKFCRYYNTHHFIVEQRRLIPICKRCAGELADALQEFAKTEALSSHLS